MNDLNFYTDTINEHLIGYVTLDNNNYAAELTVDVNEIKIRIFDFNKKINCNSIDMFSLKTITFHSHFIYYTLFGLSFNTGSFLRIGHDGSFHNYYYTAQGFLHSKLDLNNIADFTGISIHAENLKKWAGSTRKLDALITCGLTNAQPNNNDLVEFQNYINKLGTIGFYYSYVHGGLDGLHTVGMSVSPHITLEFDSSLNLSQLIEQYIDLYMILRFIIGDALEVSKVSILNEDSYHYSFRDKIYLYLPEKKPIKTLRPKGIFIPYASIYRDATEDTFPNIIWESYYNESNHNNKALLKKFISYSMVNNSEDKFLGFYRIIESITMKNSYFVDEESLSNLLNRSRKILSKRFPNTSISSFIRAIKHANKNKNNTESCIRNFIKTLPLKFTQDISLEKLKINEICQSRNNIIHKPLFSESPEKIHKNMEITETLAKLAILIKLDIPMEKIEEIAFSDGWQYIFKES